MVSSIPSPEILTSHESLEERYQRIRALSVALTRPLAPEDQVVQTILEVSPTKWHLAHVTWFFEQFCLAAYRDNYAPVHDRYHHLFNSYYHSVGDMHPRAKRGLLSRPTVTEVHDYRQRVDDAMLKLIEENGGDEAVSFRVSLGLHHEQQHQELLLTDIKHIFFSNPIGPTYREFEMRPVGSGSTLQFSNLPGGDAWIGAGPDGFSFDNETPHHRVLVAEHAMGHRLITNAEYREFVTSGGYDDSSIWLSDGWKVVNEEGWNRPLYWSEDLEQEFTLGGWQEIQPHAPVAHVGFYEADAFARWAGARLPTEAEWEIEARRQPVHGNFLEGGFMTPIPGADTLSISQLYGDVWEWTASPYGPYPGFKPLTGSLGEYNRKFMCNQMVVRGGSCVTQADHIRPTYRSFFYPKDRWQFLGFRLAKDI